jgi:translation initiation factor 1-like protein
VLGNLGLSPTPIFISVARHRWRFRVFDLHRPKSSRTLIAVLFVSDSTAATRYAQATLAGRLLKNRIRVLVNDRVQVECTPYDLTKGRIVWRDSNRL